MKEPVDPVKQQRALFERTQQVTSASLTPKCSFALSLSLSNAGSLQLAESLVAEGMITGKAALVVQAPDSRFLTGLVQTMQTLAMPTVLDHRRIEVMFNMPLSLASITPLSGTTHNRLHGTSRCNPESVNWSTFKKSQTCSSLSIGSSASSGKKTTAKARQALISADLKPNATPTAMMNVRYGRHRRHQSET